MSDSGNEKKGKEIDRDLAKLVREIFGGDGKVIQATEEDLASEDLIYDAIRRGIIRTINDLFEFMEPYLMETLKKLLEEQEGSYNSSQQSTSSS